MSHELSQISHKRIPLYEAVPLETPLVVYIEPSGYCNLKCGFCPVGIEGDQLKKAVMSYELFVKLMDDLEAFPSKVKLLRLCGNGDPLVNRQLVRMLKYAHAKGVSERIEMLTNGLLLSDELISELPKFLHRIIISIEGLNEQDYLDTCRTKVDFGVFLSKLHALYRAKGSCIIHLKIHHGAIKSEADAETFRRMVESCSDEHYIEKLVPMWPELDSELFSREFRWEESPVKPRRVCAQIFKGLQVQADGEVVPCCVDWKRVNLLGDLREQSLVEIWNGDRLRNLQVGHLSGRKSELKPCQSCTMNDYCEYDNLDDHAVPCLERVIHPTLRG
jgi:radical SAM protein with 4Fe4S-binding SPASM domain